MTVSPKQILVIDDDPDVAQAIRSLLEGEGYHIAVAQDGHKGIDYLKRHAVDLVLTDIHMPNRDGIEVILYMRANHPQIRIICMSGGMSIADHNFLNEARMLGAQRVIEKPLDPLALLADIEELLDEQK